MLKSNLLLLMQKIMEENADIKRLVEGKLIQDLTDEEISLIVSDEFKDCRVNLIYLLNILKNSEINEENKQALINLTKSIDTKEKLASAIDFIKYSLEKRKDNSEDKTIIEGYKIIVNSEGNEQALVAKRLLLECSIETAQKVSKLKTSNLSDEEKLNKALVKKLKALTQNKKKAIYSHYKYADVVETMLKAKNIGQIKKMGALIVDNNTIKKFAGNPLKIIEIVALSNEKNIAELYRFICYSQLEFDDTIEIAKIIAEAKDEEQASLVLGFINNPRYYFYATNLKIKIAKILLSSKTESNASYILKSLNVIKRDLINNPNLMEILEVISKSSLDNIPYAVNVLGNNILANENAFNLVYSICNAKSGNQAYIINKLLEHEKMLKNPHLLELVLLISTSQCHNINILYNALEVIINVDTWEIMELVNAVLKSVGEEQSKYAKDIAINKELLSSGKALALTTLAASAKKTYNSAYVYKLATNTNILKTPLVIELARRASQVEENKLIDLTPEEEQILQGITFEAKSEPLFNGIATYNIYDLLGNNPESIEELLNNMSEVDITPTTKVRARVLNENKKKDN